MNQNSWLVWTGRKLASQDLWTLARRFQYIVQRKWADRVFPTRAMARQSSLSSSETRAPKERVLYRSLPRWHWSDQDVESIVQSISIERRANTVVRAEKILTRTFTFRGHGPLSLDKGDWTPAKVSGNWIRDFNRHHWFATLGFAYRYSGEARFVACFIEESSSWMNAHAARLGRIAWDTPFEVASRLNAWLWAHFLFFGSPDWDAKHHERFLRTFGLLAEYLYQTIEFHSLGNHLFLEAKALALCGEVFPQFTGARRWREKGWRILNRELKSQICSDGVHEERSTMYHRIIAGELAELWQFCVRSDNPQADALVTAVEKMASFERWIDQGRGNFPLFGDAQLEDTYYRFSAPVIMAARSARNRSPLAEEFPDHTYWLMGGEPASAGLCGNETKPGACAFAEGGYFVARSGWAHDADVLVWDCGPVGYKQNRKHAHLDALSFTLSVSGTPLLIDPGVHEASDTGIPLRSTRVHTTVCVDGEEQGELASRAEIWSPPTSNLLLWAASDECVVMAGQHDGYVRLPGQVRHTRHILAMHGWYWLIIDSLKGGGEHLIEQRFHVVPEAHVVLDSGGDVVRINKHAASLALSWACRPVLRLDPGLAELHCGRPEPSCIVTAERKSGLPITLAVGCSSARGDVRVRPSDAPDRAGWFEVSGDGFAHCIYAGCDSSVAASLPGGWITDAKFAVIRTSAEGRQPDLLLAGARAWRNGQEPPPADPKLAGKIIRIGLN